MLSTTGFFDTVAKWLYYCDPTHYRKEFRRNKGGKEDALVLGCIRVSTETQDVRNQRHEILEFANGRGYHVDEFVEIEISSRKNRGARGIDGLIERLQAGELLIVSELSRIGRSVPEVITIINEVVKKQVRFMAIKQSFDIQGNQDMQSKVLLTIFALLAELERALVSERTKRVLDAKRAQGIKLGRPKGSLGRSKLDQKITEILELLKDRASRAFIARRLRVSRTTLVDFIHSRRLVSQQ
jgi:DNA invertase Pin-like site-specific DNA recombinase